MELKIVQKIKSSIKEELTKALYKNYPLSLLFTFLIATTLTWVLSGVLEKKYLMGWYILLCILLIARLGLFVWYRYTKTNSNLFYAHHYLFILGSSLTALSWGMIGSFIMPTDMVYQMYILIMVGGILAGALQSLSASYLASMIYIVLMLSPILTWEVIQILNGSKIYEAVFITMVLFCLYSAFVSRRSHIVLVNNIKLKLENLELINNLKKHTTQVELFSEMGELLVKCTTEEEVCTVGSKIIAKMYPEFFGGIYLLSDSQEELKLIKTWGNVPMEVLVFSRNECQAILRGRVHLGYDHKQCRHGNKKTGFFACIPFIAQEESFGILHIERISKEPFSLPNQNQIIRIANNIALTLANLRLKNALKLEATHDLLTGLFNRQYLETYLEMEMSRIKRRNTELSVMMIDIDHFKLFNDKFGHETGDEILKKLGIFLNQNMRRSDVVCRYGGEEFIVIMPEASLEVARERAEFLRETCKKIVVVNHHRTVNDITLSFGVATYPQHGLSIEEVIDAADQALYRAKRDGRDRVQLAV